MDRGLLWSALGVSSACAICCVLLARARQGSGESSGIGARFARSHLVTAILLPFLIAAATLPSRPPFASGQGLGKGFFIGGLLALLAAALVVRVTPEPHDAPNASGANAVAGPFALAVIAATLPLLFLRTVLEDALLGVAIGWFSITVVLIQGSRAGQRQDEAPHNSEARSQNFHAPAFPLAASAGFAITACLLALLGEYRGTLRFTTTQTIGWSAFGLLFASAIPFVLLFAGLPSSLFAGSASRLPGASLLPRLLSPFVQTEDERVGAARGWRILFGGLLLAGAAKLLTMRPVGQPRLFIILLLGLAAGLIAWWVVASGLRNRAEASDNRMPAWQSIALAFLVLLAGSMVAYQSLGGMGTGLLLVSAWLPLGLACAFGLEETSWQKGSEGRSVEVTANLLRILLFGTALLLYRAFSVRFANDLRGISLSDFYALFGLLTGALLPSVLASWLAKGASSPTPEDRISPPSLLRLLAAGVALLLVPGIVLILWSAKVAQALSMGLAVGIVVAEGEITGALFALGIGLALTQWAHHVLLASQLARSAKIHILWGLTGLLAVLVLIADYAGRIRRNSPNVPPSLPNARTGSVSGTGRAGVGGAEGGAQ